MDINKNTKISDIMREEMTADQAREAFGTEFDEAIHSLLGVLEQFGMTEEDFEAILDQGKRLMEATIEVDMSLTVEESMKYVYVSDLIILGLLSNAWFQVGKAAHL